MATTFVLHDDSLNTKGFRMLTSGANLEVFRANPVMFYYHNDTELPVGRWENIRIDGSRILADAVFDQCDTLAAKIAAKVAGDFVRMASMGAWPPEEVSDDPAFMLPGQLLPTVTKWTAREASITPIGANHNAVRLYDTANGKYFAAEDEASLIELIDELKTPIKINQMKKVTTLINLADEASVEQIYTAVSEVIALRDALQVENDALKAAIKATEDKHKADRAAEAITLTDTAVRDGRISKETKESFITLFDKDFEGAKTVLAGIQKRVSLAAQLNTHQVSLGDFEKKSWDELDRSNRLIALKDSNPELYAQKFAEKFGKKQ